MALNVIQAIGISKSDDKSIATGFKTAYSNGDGTYTVEFIDGSKVITAPIKGDKGDKGDKFVYEDFTPEELEDLKGDQGDKGDRGATGIGITEVVKTGTSGLVDTYTITFSDGATTTFTLVNGANVTKLSELENDEEFIKATTINLVNYYLKDEVYNKSKIDELLRNVGAGLSVKIVTSLPTEEISGTTIYLINTSGSNYNQYMYIDGEWANLGSTAVDMSSYYNKTQIDNKLDDYVTANRLTNKLDDYVLKTGLSKVGKTGSYNDLEDLPEIPSTEGFMKGRQMLGVTDLNDCRTEGTFTVSTASANLPNITIYGTYVDLQVLSIETVVSQIVRLIYNGEPMMWSRCWIIDHWTDWVHAISSDMATDVLEDNPKSYPTSKVVYDEVQRIDGEIQAVNDSLVDIESALEDKANALVIDARAYDDISSAWESLIYPKVNTKGVYSLSVTVKGDLPYTMIVSSENGVEGVGMYMGWHVTPIHFTYEGTTIKTSRELATKNNTVSVLDKVSSNSSTYSHFGLQLKESYGTFSFMVMGRLGINLLVTVTGGDNNMVESVYAQPMSKTNRYPQVTVYYKVGTNSYVDIYIKIDGYSPAKGISVLTPTLGTLTFIENLSSAPSGSIRVSTDSFIVDESSNITDCNSAPTGMICVNNAAHAPKTGYGYLVTQRFNRDDKYERQLFMPISSNEIYERRLINGTWDSSWVELATMDKVQSSITTAVSSRVSVHQTLKDAYVKQYSTGTTNYIQLVVTLLDGTSKTINLGTYT